MKDEALRLTLEALEFADDFIGMEPFEHVAQETADAHKNLRQSITAIKQALEQPEPEPVAWLQFKDNEPPVVAPRDLGTPVFLGVRGGLAHDAGEKK